MAEIVMPRLSDTMEEGTILRWLVADGEPVRRGQEIVEIETDKATMTYESDLDGVLADRRRRGRHAAGRAVIARVDRAAETATDADRERRPLRLPERRRAGDSHDAPPGEANADGRPGATTCPRAPPASTPRPIPARPADPGGRGGARRETGERVKASPLARRIASENDMDLHSTDRHRPGRSHRQGRRADGWSSRARYGPRHDASTRAGIDAAGSPHRQGRDDRGRAVAHPADDRPAHGRVEGHDPSLRARRPTSTWRSASALRTELKRLRPRRTRRPTTTWSSRPAPWRCASIRARTPAIATGDCSCTRASTSAWPWPPTRTSPRVER